MRRFMEQSWNARRFRPLKPHCMELNPKSVKRAFFANKINSQTSGRKAAKSSQGNRTWRSIRVKRLCNLWPFQFLSFVLEGMKLEMSKLKKLSQLIWMSELEASVCKKLLQRPKRILRKTNDEKQKVCFLKLELAWWFWRTTSMNRTNHT